MNKKRPFETFFEQLLFEFVCFCRQIMAVTLINGLLAYPNPYTRYMNFFSTAVV
jgi:hypothetical protein